MKIEYKINYSMEVDKCNIDYLTAVFKQLLVMVFTDFVKTVLEQFAEDFMKMEKKPFHCSCGNDKNFIWKTKDAKPMKVTTIFAELILPQMQIQCKACRKKMFISRLLLGQMSSMAIVMLAASIHMGKVKISAGNIDTFMQTIRTDFAIFTILCAIGIFFSLVRGKRGNIEG